MRLTQRQQDALKIIASSDAGHVGTKWFADKFWPGRFMGAVAGMRAGQYLSKLAQQGLVKKNYMRIRGNIWPDGYTITRFGKQCLLNRV